MVLRPVRAEDAGRIADACGDPEIARWTAICSPYEPDDARIWIAGHDEARLRGESVDLAIADAGSDRLIGAIGITGLDHEHSRGEVGYWVARDARGRGVATRALRLLADWALGPLGLARLDLMVIVGNEASCRVARNAGFRREGVLLSYRQLKGLRVDMVVHGRVAEGRGAGATEG